MLNRTSSLILSVAVATVCPFAVNDVEADGCVGMDLDKRFAFLIAQTRCCGAAGRRTSAKGGQHERIVARRLALLSPLSPGINRQRVAAGRRSRHVLRLVKLWLKAPVEERDDAGTRRITGGKNSKPPQPAKEKGEVLAGGGEHGVGPVAVAALEVIAVHAMFGLQIADDRLEGGAAIDLVVVRLVHSPHLDGEPVERG